jgi:hypothetical protein
MAVRETIRGVSGIVKDEDADEAGLPGIDDEVQIFHQIRLGGDRVWRLAHQMLAREGEDPRWVTLWIQSDESDNTTNVRALINPAGTVC